MTDKAHDLIASIVQGVAGCLQLNNMPAVDLADLHVVLRDDGGWCVAGTGVASGSSRVDEAVALALRDLSDQLRKAKDSSPELLCSMSKCPMHLARTRSSRTEPMVSNRSRPFAG